MTRAKAFTNAERKNKLATIDLFAALGGGAAIPNREYTRTVLGYEAAVQAVEAERDGLQDELCELRELLDAAMVF